MARPLSSFCLSKTGKERVKTAAKQKGWNSSSNQNWIAAAIAWVNQDIKEDEKPGSISEGNFKRFWAAKIPVGRDTFEPLCAVIGINWWEVYDEETSPGHELYKAELEALNADTKHTIPLVNSGPFIGRNLDKFHKALSTTERLIITNVNGMGGIGKTELVIRYGHKYLASYPDGICWVNVRDDTPEERIISFFCHTLDQKLPESCETIKQKLEYCFANWPTLGKHPPGAARALIIFDDVDEFSQIEACLPSSKNFKVIVTSRKRFNCSFHLYNLNILSEQESLQVIRKLLGSEDKRITSQETDAKKICAFVEYLPLGLQLVGRFMAHVPDYSFTNILEELERFKLETEALNRTEPGMSPVPRGVAAALELSWDHLKKNLLTQCLAYLLSLYAVAPIPWESVEEALSDITPQILSVTRQFELINFNLLRDNGDRTYSVHQLVHAFFRVKLNDCGEEINLRKALLETYKQKIFVSNRQDIRHGQYADLFPHILFFVNETVEKNIHAYKSTPLFIQLSNYLSYLGKFNASNNLLKKHELFIETTNINNISNKERLPYVYPFIPSIRSAKLELAHSFYELGKYDEAEQHIISLLESDGILVNLNDLDSGDDGFIYYNANIYLCAIYAARNEKRKAITIALILLTKHVDYIAKLFPELSELIEATILNYLVSSKELDIHPNIQSFHFILIESFCDEQKYSFLKKFSNVIELLANLGTVFLDTGEFASGENVFRLLINLVETSDISAKTSMGLEFIYASLGTACRHQYKYYEAIENYKKSLKLRKELYGEDHHHTIKLKFHIAELYYDNDYFEMALKLVQEILPKLSDCFDTPTDTILNIYLLYIKIIYNHCELHEEHIVLIFNLIQECVDLASRIYGDKSIQYANICSYQASYCCGLISVWLVLKSSSLDINDNAVPQIDEELSALINTSKGAFSRALSVRHNLSDRATNEKANDYCGLGHVNYIEATFFAPHKHVLADIYFNKGVQIGAIFHNGAIDYLHENLDYFSNQIKSGLPALFQQQFGNPILKYLPSAVSIKEIEEQQRQELILNDEDLEIPGLFD